MQEKGLKDSS